MAKYMNIFKLVIPDRTWLMRKIEEGYTFTLVGSNLHLMMQTSAPKSGNCDLHKYDNIGLFIVKSEELLCPLETGSVDVPMFLHRGLYEGMIENERDGLFVTSYAVEYAHMVKGRCKIMGPVEDRGESAYTLQDTTMKLFSIMIPSPGDNSGGLAYFHINKHDSMYSDWNKF
ncbi:hypothetical protein LTR22_023299 [Elasticomyces elasticus]|nr:hypothetical protein LTR22_023299 [Elasticomyces elasticus]